MDTPSSSAWKKTLYASVAAQFLCMVGLSFGFSFLALYIKSLEPGMADTDARRWAGWAAAASGFTMACFAPIWGIVADKYSRKMMVLRSMFGAAIMMAAMAFVRRPEHVVMLRFIQGALTGTISANAAMVASTVPKDRAGWAMGLFYGAMHAGHVLGPALGGPIADHFGYSRSFLCGSVLVFLAALLVKFFTYEPAREARESKEGQGSLVALFSITGFVLAALAMFQVQFATNIAAPVFSLFVAALHGESARLNTIAGLLMAVNAGAAVIASGLLGRLGDRWGHRRMLVLSAFATAVIVSAQALVTNVTQLFFLRALLGFATAGIQPAAGALIRSAVPDHSVGKAFGIVQSVRSIGMALGPLAGGYLSASFAGILGFRVCFLVTGAGLLVVPIIIWWFNRAGASARAAAVVDREKA